MAKKPPFVARGPQVCEQYEDPDLYAAIAFGDCADQNLDSQFQTAAKNDGCADADSKRSDATLKESAKALKL